jgi:hypothetical protein
MSAHSSSFVLQNHVDDRRVLEVKPRSRVLSIPRVSNSWILVFLCIINNYICAFNFSLVKRKKVLVRNLQIIHKHHFKPRIVIEGRILVNRSQLVIIRKLGKPLPTVKQKFG